MKRFSNLLATMAATIALLIGASASAATMGYTDVVGTFVSFTGIQETSSSDPLPLFDQPIIGGSGNQLLFFPSAFESQTAGAAGFDSTQSLLELTISGNSPTETITEFKITEFGDTTLIGGGGTAGTSTFVSMAGFLTITHDINGAIAPVVVNILDSASFDYVNDFGSTLWSLTATIDLTAYVPNATQATLSLDNDLYSFSEAGTSAKIQKKVVNGPAVLIEVVPEPSTGLLFAGGLLGVALRARQRRS